MFFAAARALSKAGIGAALALALSTAARADSTDEDPPAPVEQVGTHANGELHGLLGEDPAPLPLLSGILEGRVIWSGPMPVPSPLARNAEPYCARLGEALDGSVAVSHSGLGGVLIRLRPLRSFNRAAATKVTIGSSVDPATALKVLAKSENHRTSEPHHIDLASCAFAPRVLGLSRGEHLLIESVDPILHAVRITKERSVVYRRTLQRQQPAPELRFGEPGIYRVGCDVHPWEVAWVVVAPPEDLSVFAVTDAQGHFHLEGAPPGSYAIDAWHERARITGPTVRIHAGASTHATLLAEPQVALAQDAAPARASP